MADEFSLAVENTVKILDKKKGEWCVGEIFSYDALSFSVLPSITVNFLECRPERLNRCQTRLFIRLDIWYYHAEWTMDVQKDEIDKMLWNISHWLLTHQTMNSYALMTTILNTGFHVRPRVDKYVAGGLVQVELVRDRVDITDISDS